MLNIKSCIRFTDKNKKAKVTSLVIRQQDYEDFMEAGNALIEEYNTHFDELAIEESDDNVMFKTEVLRGDDFHINLNIEGFKKSIYYLNYWVGMEVTKDTGSIIIRTQEGSFDNEVFGTVNIMDEDIRCFRNELK